MADHTAIVTEAKELMEAGQKAAATRLVGRYARGADSSLGEDLADRAQMVLDREVESFARRVSAANRERAARQVAQPVSATRSRRGERRAGRTRSEARVEKQAAAYFDQRDPRSPVVDRREEFVYASGLDFDRAAVPDRRGAGCLVCGIERCSADRAHKDGLCSDHREAGMTRADGIAVRCAGLVARAIKEGLVSPRDAVAQAWRRANTDDRALIEQWVTKNPQALTTA